MATRRVVLNWFRVKDSDMCVMECNLCGPLEPTHIRSIGPTTAAHLLEVHHAKDVPV